MKLLPSVGGWRRQEFHRKTPHTKFEDIRREVRAPRQAAAEDLHPEGHTSRRLSPPTWKEAGSRRHAWMLAWMLRCRGDDRVGGAAPG